MSTRLSNKGRSSLKNESSADHSLSRDTIASKDKKSSNYKKKLQTKESLKKQEQTPLFNSHFPLEEIEPTKEELKYREERMNELTILEISKKFYSCTKCNKNYQKLINENQKISVHPFLGVLMCEDCCAFYGDGDFSLDSDGEDKYCRWCGEGGKIFSCSKCIYGFCSTCIKKNFGSKHIKEIQEDDDWICFSCNPKPLWHLRFVCSLAKIASEISEVSSEKKRSQKTTNINKKRKIDALKKTGNKLSDTTSSPKQRKFYVLSNSEESDEDDIMISSKKLNDALTSIKEKNSNLFSSSKNLGKLQKILRLLECQMSCGLNWSTKSLKKLTKSNYIKTDSDFVKECQKIKWCLSLMSSHLLEFCSVIESFEQSLPKEVKNNESVIRGDEENGRSDLDSYTDILLFLGFVNNQVKTFMNEGISVQSLAQAESINNNEFIGIKKPKNAQTGVRTENASEATLGEILKDVRSENEPKTNTFNETELDQLNTTSKNVCSEMGSGLKKLFGSPSTSNIDEENLTSTNGSKDKYDEIMAILENY